MSPLIKIEDHTCAVLYETDARDLRHAVELAVDARADLAHHALHAAEGFPDWESTYAAYDRILLRELEQIPPA